MMGSSNTSFKNFFGRGLLIGEGLLIREGLLLRGGVYSVMSSDINMDGFLDIVISGTEPYAINVLLGYENENFQAQTIYL